MPKFETAVGIVCLNWASQVYLLTRMYYFLDFINK